jgi:hypothetical protein
MANAICGLEELVEDLEERAQSPACAPSGCATLCTSLGKLCAGRRRRRIDCA